MKKTGVLLICAMLGISFAAGLAEGEQRIFRICANGAHTPNEEAIIIREAKGMQKGIIGSQCTVCGRMISLTFYREEMGREFK